MPYIQSVFNQYWPLIVEHDVTFVCEYASCSNQAIIEEDVIEEFEVEYSITTEAVELEIDVNEDIC